MTQYRITVLGEEPAELIIEANSSDEAIELVKVQLNTSEISGDIEQI